MIHVQGDTTLTIGPYGSAGTCIINYAPRQITNRNHIPGQNALVGLLIFTDIPNTRSWVISVLNPVLFNGLMSFKIIHYDNYIHWLHTMPNKGNRDT